MCGVVSSKEQRAAVTRTAQREAGIGRKELDIAQTTWDERKNERMDGRKHMRCSRTPCSHAPAQRDGRRDWVLGGGHGRTTQNEQMDGRTDERAWDVREHRAAGGGVQICTPAGGRDATRARFGSGHTAHRGKTPGGPWNTEGCGRRGRRVVISHPPL